MTQNPFVQKAPAQDPNVGFATVAGVTNEGVLLQLDEEEEPGDKAYKRILDAYPDPQEGDRIMFRRVGGSLVIHGRVG